MCTLPRAVNIAGGTLSSTGQFPYSVEIIQQFSDGTYAFCGGSLINRRYILTAAHCFLETQGVPQRMYAVLGTTDLNSNSATIVPLIAGIYHPGFNNNTIENDIALAVLSRDVAETDLIQYALLATQKAPANTKLTVAGWGITSSNQRSPPAQQSYAELSVVDGSSCARYFQEYNMNENLCLYGDNQQPCQGDSGSGLVEKNGDRFVVNGIVSFGADSCTSRSDSLNAFTNVALYYNLIALNANATSLPAGTATSPILVAAQLPPADATNPPSDPGTVSGTSGVPPPTSRNANSAITTTISSTLIVSWVIFASVLVL